MQCVHRRRNAVFYLTTCWLFPTRARGTVAPKLRAHRIGTNALCFKFLRYCLAASKLHAKNDVMIQVLGSYFVAVIALPEQLLDCTVLL
jgi:hypothetical protein